MQKLTDVRLAVVDNLFFADVCATKLLSLKCRIKNVDQKLLK